MDSKVKYPAPQGNPETAPFWEAAKQGKFLIKRCTACGEAHPKVQVKNCDLAVAHGTGGLLGVRHAASTCILERA